MYTILFIIFISWLISSQLDVKHYYFLFFFVSFLALNSGAFAEWQLHTWTLLQIPSDRNPEHQGPALSNPDSSLGLGRDCLHDLIFFFELMEGPQGITGAEVSAGDICGYKSAGILSLGCPGG